VFTINKNPSPSDLRGFGRAMLIGFGGLALMLGSAPWWRAWWNGNALPPFAWLGVKSQWWALAFGFTGLLLALISVIRPAAAKVVYVTWMTVTVPVGIVMSAVLLTLIYVFILPPFAWIVRRSDPLRRKRTKQGSYWEEYQPHEPTLERMRRPF
jgi:hypothetical protein